MEKLHELRLKLIKHPLLECLLFPNLKKFSPNTEVIEAINEYFESLGGYYFSKGTKSLEKRWTKCVVYI